MRTIELTQGYEALIDDDDYDRVSQYNWCASVRDSRVYAQHSVKLSGGAYTQESLHRFIMNATKGTLVDHIDRNGLNNQKSNLRVCDHKQNQWNRDTNSNTGYKGISESDNGTYKVQFAVTFDTLEEAIVAYNEMATKYHKEFAVLNKMEPTQ